MTQKSRHFSNTAIIITTALATQLRGIMGTRGATTIPSSLETRLQNQLEQRIQISSNRSLDLPDSKNTIDFSSNDYLGLAHSTAQHEKVQSKYKDYTATHLPPYLGSTGSRLLSGNSALALQLEKFLAKVHNRPAALICNSGYDANLSVLSSIPLPNDIIILDELVHNSLIMGVKMSRIPLNRVHYFRHNDVRDLERILSSVKKTLEPEQSILVVVESVYSMDGDISPLRDILDLALDFNASVVVDEAHGLGVFGHTNAHDTTLSQHKHENRTHNSNTCGGTGVLAALNLENHPALLATVYTFGKAAGCHGAVITGSKILIDYLVNYARPFIYSTSLPLHSLWAIKCAYDTMIGKEGEDLREKVFHLVKIFRSRLLEELQKDDEFLLPSPSPIQAVLCRGNETCIEMANKLRKIGHVAVYPIRSPTVPKGEERIRIIIHAHNTEQEVLHLVECLLCFAKNNSQGMEADKLMSKL